MRNGQIEVLLLANSKLATSTLAHFLEKHGCLCLFATPETGAEVLKSHAFDLVLSSLPLKQSDSLVRALKHSRCRIFYRFPVEDGHWWVPLDGQSAKCIGREALRSSEFRPAITGILQDLRQQDASIDKQPNGGATP